MKTISLKNPIKCFHSSDFHHFHPWSVFYSTGAKSHDSSKAKTKQMYFKELSVSRIFHVVNLWTSAISSCKALHDLEAEQTKVLISPKTSRAPIDEGHRARLTTFFQNVPNSFCRVQTHLLMFVRRFLGSLSILCWLAPFYKPGGCCDTFQAFSW